MSQHTKGHPTGHTHKNHIYIGSIWGKGDSVQKKKSPIFSFPLFKQTVEVMSFIRESNISNAFLLASATFYTEGFHQKHAAFCQVQG